LREGSPKHLMNPKKGKGGKLNTKKGKESFQAIEERLLGVECPVGDDPLEPNLCPVNSDYLAYAKCFNEHYEEDADGVYIPSAAELYEDYKGLFDYGFSTTDDVSSSPLNNKVTNNRWPGMMLRMCFHDNAVNPYYAQFQDYIEEHLEEIYIDSSGYRGYDESSDRKNLENGAARKSKLVMSILCTTTRLHQVKEVKEENAVREADKVPRTGAWHPMLDTIWKSRRNGLDQHNFWTPRVLMPLFSCVPRNVTIPTITTIIRRPVFSIRSCEQICLISTAPVWWKSMACVMRIFCTTGVKPLPFI
jgi:hypothetical protein